MVPKRFVLWFRKWVGYNIADSKDFNHRQFWRAIQRRFTDACRLKGGSKYVPKSERPRRAKADGNAEEDSNTDLDNEYEDAEEDQDADEAKAENEGAFTLRLTKRSSQKTFRKAAEANDEDSEDDVEETVEETVEEEEIIRRGKPVEERRRLLLDSFPPLKATEEPMEEDEHAEKPKHSADIEKSREAEEELVTGEEVCKRGRTVAQRRRFHQSVFPIHRPHKRAISYIKTSDEEEGETNEPAKKSPKAASKTNTEKKTSYCCKVPETIEDEGESADEAVHFNEKNEYRKWEPKDSRKPKKPNGEILVSVTDCSN
jgi:hypothetical protein